jgi:hypothetical protein
MLLSSFQTPEEQTRTINFHVERGGERIGTLSVLQKVSKHRTTYTLSSDVEVEFLFNIQVTEKITDVFEDGYLLSSSHQRYVNGVLKVDQSVHRGGVGYLVVDQGDRMKQLEDGIEQSILTLYFQEPTHGTMVYSQNFRRMLRLEEIGAHRYSVELPNGTTTTFSYEEGVLTKVQSDTYVGDVKFLIKQ